MSLVAKRRISAQCKEMADCSVISKVGCDVERRVTIVILGIQGCAHECLGFLAKLSQDFLEVGDTEKMATLINHRKVLARIKLAVITCFNELYLGIEVFKVLIAINSLYVNVQQGLQRLVTLSV